MKLTTTEEIILREVIFEFATAEQRLAISSERNWTSQVKPEPKERPPLPSIPIVEEARAIVLHAFENNFTPTSVALIISKHINWTGKTRDLKGRSIKNFATCGYNFMTSNNEWIQIFRDTKCQAIIDILTEYFPKYKYPGKEKE